MLRKIKNNNNARKLRTFQKILDFLLIENIFRSQRQSRKYNSKKNGVIFYSGINTPPNQFAKTTIDIKKYSPQTRIEFSSGFTLNAYSHLISFAEIKLSK